MNERHGGEPGSPFPQEALVFAARVGLQFLSQSSSDSEL
jgi:hypothetical protein